MESGEHKLPAARERVAAMVAELKKKAKFDDAVRELAFEREFDTLQFAVERGDAWAAPRLEAVEKAISGYVTAGNAARMDAFLELKNQVQQITADFESNRKRAA